MMSITHETANNIWGDVEQQGKGAYKVANDDGDFMSLLHIQKELIEVQKIQQDIIQ